MPKVLVTDAKGLHQESGNGFDVAVSGSNEAGHIDLKCGADSNKPAYLSLQSENGTTWYLHADIEGNIRVHSAVPVTGSNGTVVGTQS